MKTLLLSLTVCLLITTTLSVTNLIIYLEPQEEICLHEYLADKTLVIYELAFNTTSNNVKISDPEEKVLAEKERVTEFKEAFTTFSGGYYEICVTNKDREHVSELNFFMKHGVAAKDYSSIAKAKDLKPMELDVRVVYLLTNKNINSSN